MFNITEHNFGEFAGLYSERADGLREKYNLVAISENDENYENEFDKWCEIVKTEILDTNSDPMPTVFEMVEKALKTGDYLELAPHSVSNTDEYEIDLSSLK